MSEQLTIENSVRRSQYGSPVDLAGDPGFNFEIHVVSNINSSTNSTTTELQVTAVRELDGVTVECTIAGTGSPIRSTIQVASSGKLIIIMIVFSSL